MIIFEHVTKRYPGGTVAVDELSLEVPDGKIMILVGPSGCGKTTTLRMVNRLVEPTRGRVLPDGRDVAQTRPVGVYPVTEGAFVDTELLRHAGDRT